MSEMNAPASRVSRSGIRPSLAIASLGVEALGAVEAWTAAALLTAQLAMRTAYALRQGIDTDEPQHLHVAWAWTRGLVPYRDVFDNHAPLFHLTMAPLVAALGERPDLLIAMRLAMLPLTALLLWSTYRIGRALSGARVGVWAAVLVGTMPTFLLTSIQFRADDLWALLWLAALATALGGPPAPGRALAAGLLIGATFATSMKTCLLFATLLGGVALVLAIDPRVRLELRQRRVWTSIVASVAGMVVVIAMVVTLFAHLGALSQLVDLALTHNLAGRSRWDHRAPRVAMFVVTFPLIVALGAWVLRNSPSRGFARGVIVIATLLYITTLNGFWPIVTRQDSLPFYPLLAVLVVGALLEAFPARSATAIGLLASIAVVEGLLTLSVSPLHNDGTRFYVGMVGDVLRLTSPGDPVMDLKGETLFRRRPFFYALEDITRERMRQGDLADDIAERLVATRTYVSVVDSPRFPTGARQFLNDNYVPIGRLRVAGQLFAADAVSGAAFTIAIPGRYAIVSPQGTMDGTLDGTPLEGSRMLEAGPHVFRPPATAEKLAVVWADAVERGFSPFRVPP